MATPVRTPDDDRPGLSAVLPPPTPAQWRALLALARREQATRHVVDYRVSVPTLFWGSWYVVLLAGRERRNASRLAAEGQTSLGRRTALISLVLGLTLALAVFGALCLAYLAKSLAGIDLFPGPSPLHALYALMRGR